MTFYWNFIIFYGVCDDRKLHKIHVFLIHRTRTTDALR